MLKIHPNRTLDDARRVIRDYDLDQLEWGGIGTAEGFANRLFVPGTEMTTTELADAYRSYVDDCAARGTEEVDREWDQRAKDLLSTLRRRADQRSKAAAFIRDVKFKGPGHLCWQLVAALATTDDRLSLLSRLPGGLCEDLQAVLHGIEALEPLFPSWYALPYRPGQNPFVDACLQLDIERFDITLETAQPWTGQEEDWFDEASALLRLAKGSDVHKELATVIEASASPVDESARQVPGLAAMVSE